MFMVRDVLVQLVSYAPPCPLHAATGLHCPLCGSSRAVLALFSADPASALRLSPLLFVGVVLAGVYAGVPRVRPVFASRRFVVGLVVFVTLVSVARNVVPAFAPFPYG